MTFEELGTEVRGHVPDDLQIPAGMFWLKMPLFAAPGSATTVELAAGSHGYLAWVPASVWTSGAGGKPLDLSPWIATRVIFESCRRAGTYLGGLLSSEPAMCLTLHIRQSSTNGVQNLKVGTDRQC